ncbi:MAG: type II toxin-antitoxin system RelE/ParE family toxin [Rhodanobacteraceae bacterium]|nr:type II toxin-antitoxin system RelE/ParE family toxin [Rhodanobacteraceae bacterium]
MYWTPGARRRLKEIETYIAERGSPEIARSEAARLIRRTMTLQQPPLTGKRLRRYVNADVRQLLERPYRLIYRVTAERIEIITVLDYRQLMPSDLEGLGQARCS